MAKLYFYYSTMNAGKTTTLRMLYTLMKPETGHIRVDGIDISSDPDGARRRLGVLPDARGLYKRLTARENIEYFGRLQGLDEKALKVRTDALIKAATDAGVHEMIVHMPDGYDTHLGPQGTALSGGQRQSIGKGQTCAVGSTSASYSAKSCAARA